MRSIPDNYPYIQAIIRCKKCKEYIDLLDREYVTMHFLKNRQDFSNRLEYVKAKFSPKKEDFKVQFDLVSCKCGIAIDVDPYFHEFYKDDKKHFQEFFIKKDDLEKNKLKLAIGKFFEFVEYDIFEDENTKKYKPKFYFLRNCKKRQLKTLFFAEPFKEEMEKIKDYYLQIAMDTTYKIEEALSEESREKLKKLFNNE